MFFLGVLEDLRQLITPDAQSTHFMVSFAKVFQAPTAPRVVTGFVQCRTGTFLMTDGHSLSVVLPGDAPVQVGGWTEGD
jgi:hypothetical protein